MLWLFAAYPKLVTYSKTTYMLSLSQLHFSDTRRLAEKIDRDNLVSWLLRDGYYPEQYVLPPCFTVEKFEIKNEPYYPVKNKKLHPTPADLLNISGSTVLTMKSE
jgi:hypothetical protein